ncbi:Apolipoprotein B-100 [Nymphon striatum]|nr:Apolipoprotein B-100 [Nymphon striatum]
MVEELRTSRNKVGLRLSVQSSSECIETGNYLKNGIEYEYKYTGEAVASAVGTTDRQGGIKYDCEIAVKPVKSCNFLLKVKSCKLFSIPSPGNLKELYQEHSYSSDFNKLMTDNSLIFQMSDGGILNIKHSNEEILWILNIKRGMVSSFLVSKSKSKQNGEWKSHTDVQGTCPQKVTVDPEDETKLETVKDMLFCKVPQKKYYELSPWSLFNNMTFIQNLIKSSYICDYTVNEEGIKKMECKERHAILLESSHDTKAAVQTNVMKSLLLLNTKRTNGVTNVNDDSQVESSVVFDYEESTQKPTNPTYFRTQGLKMMADLVQTTKEETRLFTITMFTDFLKHIRSSPDLVQLVKDIKNCKFMNRCNKYEKERALAFMQDALVQCNTAACAEGFRVILKDVTDLYFNMATWTWSNGHVTDAKFADEVLKMCKDRFSRTCWFSLGTIVGKLADRYQKTIYRQFPDGIYNSVKYFVDQMNEDCSPAKTGDKNQLNHILTMIKSLINVGPKLFYVSPDVSGKMVKCLKNQNIPADIVVAATQLSGLGPKIEGVTKYIWKIVGDEDLDVQVRVEAYLAMANTDGSEDTAQKIVDFLSTIKSRQVKHFIVSHIRKLIRNDFRDHSRLTNFDSVFYEAGPRPLGNKQLSDSLMVVFEDPKYEGLLDEVKNYHGRYSSIESGNYMHFLELDSWRTYRNSFGYIAEDSTIYQIASNQPRFLSTNHTIELFDKVMNYFEVGASVKGTSKTILDNIKMMHSKVAKLMKSDPYFMSYLKVVGKYATMITLSDIQALSMDIQKQVGELPLMLQKLSQGMNRDNHRNIKIIEAFHQFPTSIGLPLNWTTDATLSVSFRSGLKVDMMKQQANFHLKPSGALTFINSMFVVLPTVIDAGIQTNSSAYTSRQWDFTVKKVSSSKISLSIAAPKKTQEVLNLFRTNFIYHEKKAEALSDYDIQRVSKSWCQEGIFKKLTGVKACHQKSYANVTDLIKPWFPMAGWAKWRLALYKADQNLKSYDFTFSEGSYTKRTVSSVLKLGRNIEFKTTVPEAPKFLFEFKHTRGDKKYDASINLKDSSGNPYELSYKKIKATESINSSPKNIYEDVAISDKVFKVTLPEEVHTWTYKNQMKLATYAIDASVKFLYEKTKGKTSWLHPILPDIFWEEGKKSSWVLFKAKIDPRYLAKSGGKQINGLFYLNVPKTDLEVKTERINSELGNSMVINAKKIRVVDKKLMSFADITLSNEMDFSTPGQQAAIDVKFNITVPRHSIGFTSSFQSTKTGTFKTSYVLTFAKMIPKAESDWFHEWGTLLNDECTDGAATQGATEAIHLSKEKLIDQFWIDAALTYPHRGKENTITMKGHVIADYREMKGISVFRQAEIYSKLHDSTYKWTYYFGRTQEDLKIHGGLSHFYPASELYGEYKLSLDNKLNPWNMQLNHYINGKHFKFSSSIVTPEPKPNDLIITIDTSSDIWKSLNFNLYQHFSFGPSGWETMNCSDSFSSITVNANWTDPWYKTLLKTIEFTSKTEMMPSMKLDITHKDVREYEANLLFKDTGNSLKLTRTTPDAMKSTDYDLHYVENNSEKHMGMAHLRILSSHVLVGNVSYDMEPMKSLTKKMADRFNLMKELWNKIKDDPNHDMNKLVATWVSEKTIVKFVESRRNRRLAIVKAIKEYAYGFMKTWDVFYEPSLEIPVNAWKMLKLKMGELSEDFRQKTYSGWAWYYFNVPEMLKSPRLQAIVKGELTKLSGRTLVIPKKDGFMFMESPKVTPELRDFFRNKKVETSSPKHSNYQTAIVYGDGEIYTFDGKTYRFSGYPADSCSYVLASDFLNGAFSILKSENSITLVLNNNFYKINNKNEIFVNDETTPSSLPLDISVKKSEIRAYISGMENVVEINTDAGLYIACDSLENTCTIKLDKKYGGKTSGLLGNFDGESFNDFKHRKSDHRFVFICFILRNDWQKSCRDTYLIKDNTEKCSTRNEKHIQSCNELFDHKSITSENYYCFKKVFSEPFLEACKRRASCSEFSACEFQSAYRAACYNRGIKLRACQKCKDGLMFGHTKTMGTTRTVQIALIVDQSSKMFDSDSTANGLKSLIEEIDSTFEKKKGYSSRLFSLVSFGHSEKSAWETPQIHLEAGKVWNSANTVEKSLLKSLKFKGKNRNAPIHAIEFAAKHLRFDPEASKVFIVVTVDDTLGSRDVGKTLKMLKSSGVSLYTVADFPSVHKGKHVYGVRGDGYVFPHPKAAKRADEEILFVTVPNSPLAKVTSGLSGAIFHRNFLEENENNAYFKELAEEILAKVFKEIKVKSVKRCTCIPDELWGLKTTCSQ